MIELYKDGARMKVALLGGELRAYQDAQGRERLWCGDAAVWKGVSPVLFPAIGALKDGGAAFEGRRYAVPRHGFARDLPFEVTEQGEDFVTLTLEDNEETRKVYPYRFGLSVTHRFVPNGFETRFTVENHSGREMPFLIGGHPGFACPMEEGERFEDYVVRFEKPEEGVLAVCGEKGLLYGEGRAPLTPDGRDLPLRHEDFDRLDTYIFAGLKSRRVELINPATGRGVRLSFPEMPVLAIWSPPHKNAPYVCLEPWHGLPAYAAESGRFEDKPYHVKVGVGGAFSCGYRAEFLEGGMA